MVTNFEKHLSKSDLDKNTVTSYVWTVKYFYAKYNEINRKNLLAYKGYLMENFKPQTVDLRLQGINKYLEFIKKDKLKLKEQSEATGVEEEKPKKKTTRKKASTAKKTTTKKKTTTATKKKTTTTRKKKTTEESE